MAEPPDFFAAVFPDGYVGRGGKHVIPAGDPVPAPALLLLVILWTYIDWNWRSRPAVALFVFPDIDTLCKRRNLGKRAIEEQLGQLITARLIKRGASRGRSGYFLARPKEKEQADSVTSSENSDRSNDRRSPIDGVPTPNDRSEIADQSIGGSPIDRSGDRRSYDRPLKVELASELASERASELGRPPAAFRPIARKLLAEAILPDDCEPLSTSAQAEQNLAALLASGEPIDVVRGVLQSLRAIVDAGLQGRRVVGRTDALRWLGPYMFVGERWSHWRDAAHELARRDREAATHAATAAERAAREETDRAAREAAEDQARREYAAATPLRAKSAAVLLTAPFLQAAHEPVRTEDESRRLGFFREVDERRAEQQVLEVRLAMQRALTGRCMELGRPLTESEADEIRRRYRPATTPAPQTSLTKETNP